MYRNTEGETTEDLAVRFGQAMPEEPEVPIQADHVWGFYWDLHGMRRPSMGSTPSPLLPVDIESWDALLKVSLQVDEIELLLGMDRQFRTTWNELASAEQRHKQIESGQVTRPRQSPKQRGAL